jgi:hypothetical protein
MQQEWQREATRCRAQPGRRESGGRRGKGQRWSALGRGQRWVRQAIAISFILRVTDAASARTCCPMPIALSVAAPKLTPSRAWCRTCRGSAYQTMTIRAGKTIATKASGDSALCCFPYPFPSTPPVYQLLRHVDWLAARLRPGKPQTT